jgi:iron complex transport system ATP-binding protein
LTFAIGERKLLDSITLDLEPHRLHLIIGPNGAGKSTLIKCLLGLLNASSGDVEVDDQAVSQLSDKARATHLSYMPQQLEFFFDTQVRDFLELSRFAYDESPQTTQQKIDESLAAVDANHLKSALFNTLSGGERQRILLAACLTQQAPWMLLDEPDSALDPSHQISFKRLIAKTLERKQHSLVLITHHWNPYLDLNPRIHGLKAGKLHFSTDATHLHEHLKALFDCDFFETEVGNQRWSMPRF